MEFLLMLAVLFAIPYFFYKVIVSTFGGSKTSTQKAGNKFSPFNMLLAIFNFDLWRYKTKEGAKFMPDRDRKSVLNEKNKGLLIDGKDAHLSLKDSFTHNMIVAPTGMGKTTGYVIPNLLTLDNCSMVVTDPAGELFQATAGALQAKGFDVQVFSPESPKFSARYNPLSNINSYAHLRQLSKTLVQSSFPNPVGGSSFWNDGATDMISMLMSTLASAGKEYCNLGNCLHLLQNWGNNGQGLQHYMKEHADEHTYNQYRGFVMGNEKTTQGFLSTAMTALASLNDPEMASLLSESELRFESLRERKTVLFFILPSNKVKFYSFLMNLFYIDLFDVLMRQIPKNVRAQGKTSLPVHLLLDEFGHTSLPEFSTTCTTIRKFEVSLSIILQNFTQLATNYGESEAKTIIEGGFQSKLFYPGLPINTAMQVEAMLGKEVYREIKWMKQDHERKEQNLLNADRIRTLPNNQAIFFNSNKEAMLLETLPSYENKHFQRMMQKPYRSTILNRDLPEFRRVPLIYS